MEIGDYFKIIKKNLPAIFLIPIVFAVITLVVTWQSPFSYQSSSAIEITRYQTQKQDEVNYFLYDNYYNTQVATTFSDNVVGWVSTPSTVAETFREAGLALPRVSLRELGKTFTAKKKVDKASVVDLSYTSNNPEKAEKLMQTLTGVLKNKVEKYNSTDSSAKFVVTTANPVVIASPKLYTLNTIIAVFVGLFISLGYLFLKESQEGK